MLVFRFCGTIYHVSTRLFHSGKSGDGPTQDPEGRVRRSQEIKDSLILNGQWRSFMTLLSIAVRD